MSSQVQMIILSNQLANVYQLGIKVQNKDTKKIIFDENLSYFSFLDKFPVFKPKTLNYYTLYDQSEILQKLKSEEECTYKFEFITHVPSTKPFTCELTAMSGYCSNVEMQEKLNILLSAWKLYTSEQFSKN